MIEIETSWAAFGACPRVALGGLKRRCDATVGQPCRNLRTGRPLTLPHPGRPPYVPSADEALQAIRVYVDAPGRFKDVGPIRDILDRYRGRGRDQR